MLLQAKMAKQLTNLSIQKEIKNHSDLDFIRRSIRGDIYYFITNWSGESYDGILPLMTNFSSAVLMDPYTGKLGQAMVKTVDGVSTIKLNLHHGQGIVIRCTNNDMAAPKWRYYEVNDEKVEFTKGWTMTFLSGGPDYPQSFKADQVDLWSKQPGIDYGFFSGTAEYTTVFKMKSEGVDAWLLDLGKVNETAEVFLNGSSIGVLTGPNYKLEIKNNQLKKKNKLRIVAANKMANRIIHLERKNVFYKKFYNTNFPPK